MDSINIMKGYGKVNSINIEDNKRQQSTTNPPKPPRTTVVAIISLLLMTLIIGLFLTAIIHESNEPDDDDDHDDSLSATESIKKVCGITRYPSTCFTSLSSFKLKKPNPETIFKLSLQVTIKELTKVSSQFKSLNDASAKAAVDDCVSLFDDAVKSVNDSVTAMGVSHGEKKKKKKLTSEKVNDIRTWISAAMTDQETCLDGIKEMDQSGSMVLREVRDSMDRCKEFLSNSLAIVSNMHRLLDEFDLD